LCVEGLVMSTSALVATASAVGVANTATLARLKKDEGGATAVEFGLIAVPFVMMLLGIISVCLFFFTVLELDSAVWNAGRDVRTGIYSLGGNGKAQTYAAPPAAGADASTVAAYEATRKELLKKAICKQLREPTVCESKIRLLMVKFNKGEAITSKPSCRDSDGALVSTSSIAEIDPDAFIVVKACYAWEFGAKLPFFKVGNLPNDGGFLVEATTAFVTEKYK
jgi:Flp pilus assembly pilin Flp